MSVLLQKRADGVAIVTLDRPQVLNALDVPAKERLGDVWQEISPKAGDVPIAFTTFREKIDLLATGTTFANKVTQNSEAIAMRLVESSRRELGDFRQREQMYQQREQLLVTRSGYSQVNDSLRCQFVFSGNSEAFPFERVS